MLSDKPEGQLGSKEEKQPRLQQQSDSVSFSLVYKKFVLGIIVIVLHYRHRYFFTWRAD